MPLSPRILFCHCAYAQVLPQQTKEAVLAALRHASVQVDEVPDLCELASRCDPFLKDLVSAGPVRVAACYPRAVKGLFAAAGARLPENAEICNLRTEHPQAIVSKLLGAEETPVPPNAKANVGDTLEAPWAPGRWLPWYPVIDRDLCTDCMQCLSFCLFGVFGVDTQSRLEVQHPENCKTNCPACSRVCPEAAIIFPKHKAGPINGAPLTANDLNREKMKVDISALLGGDVYALLRQRSERAQPRFSKERDPQAALEERRKCLAQLANLDIPPEVLMALPSPEEIQRRAEEAKARARAAAPKAEP